MAYKSRVKNVSNVVYDGGCEIHAAVRDGDLPHAISRIERTLEQEYADLSLQGLEAFHREGLTYCSFRDSIGFGISNGQKGYAVLELINMGDDHAMLFKIARALGIKTSAHHKKHQLR